MYLDLPKWMVFALQWSKQNAKTEFIPVEITAFPEAGEIILRHTKKQGVSEQEFIVNALGLKGMNPVQLAHRPKDKLPSVAEIKASRKQEANYLERLNTEIDYHKDRIKHLEKQSKLIKKIQSNRLSPADEFKRNKAIAEIDADRSRQNWIKGSERRKYLANARKKATKKQTARKK